VSTAAADIAALDPTHRLVSTLTAAELGELDVVHLHHALAWEELSGLMAARSGPRLVKSIHVLQRRQNRMRGAESTRSEAAQTALMMRADRLTVATSAARDMLCEDHPEVVDLETRLVTLPLVPPMTTLHGARPPYPSDTPPMVLAVGRFDRLKGTDLLVDVVAALLTARPTLRVVIAGGLPDHPKYERRWLKSFRERLPEDAHERFAFVGWQDADKLLELYRQAAVYLAPSRLETCGLALMEALAAGCPTVATDIPAHREVARDAALLVPQEASAMVEAALSLIDDGAVGMRLGRRGPACIPERAGVVSQWLHFWEQTR
jgi:glycosyltransferase involved in cell wall biosynthesis